MRPCVVIQSQCFILSGPVEIYRVKCLVKERKKNIKKRQRQHENNKKKKKKWLNRK